MTLLQFIFYLFSAILLLSGIMVIVSRNPVQGVLYLVLTFFASAVLWMLLQAEFLSLALIFVYVGAVLTLFLFVVMMINIDLAPLREGFVRYLPFGIIAIVLLVALMLFVIGPKHFGLSFAVLDLKPADYSNVKEIGSVLYTQYLYEFELAAVILLVAIVAAISLTFRGRRDRKAQNVASQVNVNPKDRVRLIKMPVERK
jgi:NADH-quinone oxidoreductase subunit J